MPFKKSYFFLLLLIFSLSNKTSSQSLGIIYEASSFNLQDFYYNHYSNSSGLIKIYFLIITYH